MTLRLVEALVDETHVHAPLVHLLGRPCVSQDGAPCHMAEGGGRLLAFLALNRGKSERAHVAAVLWPDVDELRALGNLRSALWRLSGAGATLVRADKRVVTLAEEVAVDVHLIGDWAARLISGKRRPLDSSVMPPDIERLVMLPGWYDDWVLLERERLRQRLLHAMECLSRELTREGRHAEAVEAALIAVSAEPLRESAQRVLIEAHLSEGNQCEARRRFDEHRALVRRELGVDPSPDLASLVHRAPGTSGEIKQAPTTPVRRPSPHASLRSGASPWSSSA